MLMLSVVWAEDQRVDSVAFPVNQVPSYHVQVWLNRRYADDSVVRYRIGERLEIGLRTTANAYVYLFNIHTDGSVIQLFPNRVEPEGYLYKDVTKYIGVDASPYRLTAAGPKGRDYLVALASKTPINTRSLASFADEDTVLAQGEHSVEAFVNLLETLTAQLASENWSLSTIAFDIH